LPKVIFIDKENPDVITML